MAIFGTPTWRTGAVCLLLFWVVSISLVLLVRRENEYMNDKRQECMAYLMEGKGSADPIVNAEIYQKAHDLCFHDSTRESILKEKSTGRR